MQKTASLIDRTHVHEEREREKRKKKWQENHP